MIDVLSVLLLEGLTYLPVTIHKRKQTIPNDGKQEFYQRLSDQFRRYIAIVERKQITPSSVVYKILQNTKVVLNIDYSIRPMRASRFLHHSLNANSWVPRESNRAPIKTKVIY